jgi:hypothetical protein
MEMQPDSEWSDLPLFRTEDKSVGENEIPHLLSPSREETDVTPITSFENMTTEQLEREYLRVLGYRSTYYTDGTKESLLHALRNPLAEEQRIRRMISEENAAARAHEHGA